MAYVKKDIDSSDWTLILSNVTDATFQNASQFGMYINFTSSTTAPTDAVGLVYGPWEGELNKTVSDISSAGGYIWAKSISRSGSVIVEE